MTYKAPTPGRFDRRTNTTDYEHPQETNLLSLERAMQYNTAGQPVIRTHVDGITLEGDVLVSNVTVDSGNITVWQGTNPWIIKGNVDVVGNISGITTLPAIHGNVSITQLPALGNVSITQLPNITGNVGVSGNIDITRMPAITGNVSVTQGTTPWQVTGNVNATLTGQEVGVTFKDASKETAFGELYGLTITPVIQLDSIYGTTSDVIDTFVYSTGTADGNTGLFQARSGTGSSGYATITSKRFLRYRPGQGALARFTAAFDPTVAQTNQRAGLFNREAALQVGIHDDGVHGTRFGVLRASGGRTHITVLTIDTAPTGAQTATLTLNGVAYTITGITAGTTTDTAVRIAQVGGFTGWFVDQVDNTLVFSSLFTGPANDTFSFSSTGSGTLATGTFSTKQVGVAQTENWTYQDDFSEDTLKGTGPSGMTLAPEHLNVYQINFRWLGAGVIRYAIEDHTTGRMILFHQEHYTNRYNVPHISNPSFRLGYISQNVGSTTSATVSGASMMGAIEGDIVQNELNRSTSVNKTTLAQNTTHHLLTLRNPYVTNGKSGAQNGNYVFNAKEIILKDVTVATQGNDPAILYVFFNATSFSGVHSYTSQPYDNGMVSTVDGTLNPAVDTAICRFATAINGQATYPMRDFRVTIPPGSSISFAITSSSNLSRVTFAVVFSED